MYNVKNLKLSGGTGYGDSISSFLVFVGADMNSKFDMTIYVHICNLGPIS